MNRLKYSCSLYLQQHSQNPINWYEWGDEAFHLALKEDKMIFLSIGYSACHWCHVFNKESFSDVEIAKFLNSHFICILVDREEHMEVDQLYMQFAQAVMGQSLGWPLNLFLTPEKQPFFAFSYLPAYPKPGFEGSLSSLLNQIQLLWDQGGRQEIEAKSKQVVQSFQQLEEVSLAKHISIDSAAKQTYQTLMKNADFSMGGFLSGPKFPHIPIMQFLLTMNRFFYLPAAKEHVFLTLRKMSQGSLFDHVEGGFFRYCIDEKWSIPHFEKMAEDQGLNAICLMEAWQASKDPYFAELAIQTLNFCIRTFIADDGGVYSSLQATSEEGEGIYYTFTKEELQFALLPEQFQRIQDIYLLESCRLNNQYILHQSQALEIYAQRKGIDLEELKQNLADDLNKLQQLRKQKSPPIRDEKKCVYLSALMGKAFLSAGICFDKERYIEIAKRCFHFIQQFMFREGNLYHVAFGSKVQHLGNLLDWAFCLDFATLMASYTADKAILQFACKLADQMITLFSAPKGGFYFTDVRNVELIIRKKEYFDSTLPCAQSIAIHALQKLGLVSGNKSYLEEAKQALSAAMNQITNGPFYSLLSAALIHGKVARITSGNEVKPKVFHELFRHFLPQAVYVPYDFAIESMPQVMAKCKGSDFLVCIGNMCHSPMQEISKISTLFEVTQ